MSKMNEMVVSLKRGFKRIHLREDGPRIEDFLPTIADIEIVDTFQTGKTVCVRISPFELKKLEELIGDKCWIVPRTTGRVDI